MTTSASPPGTLWIAATYSPLGESEADRISVDLPHCGPTIGTVVRLTPSHVAVSFRGLLVVSKLYEDVALNA